MDEETEILLRLEDIIEERLATDAEIMQTKKKTLADLIETSCWKCRRPYYQEHLQPGRICIPCWRQLCNLPKLEPSSCES